ncbi:polymer-forming cytoskeletal protein [Chitinophaga sp. G-6-1-13]|uniref:Polymer-forming cytoskeletal protein n=1 Tax=Chitinophaga fulva TaxID=2728842 RepID=A0A848GZ98_9BACT|nr:polymer-forming cytoskeletal protein [Chitinophaga fulva]NML41893.1 polymer-forming cytoskeletal protein [Chitinophaga fulva]
MLREFQMLTAEQALNQHQIQIKVLESEEAFMDMIGTDGYFYVHKGDLHLQGDLIIDTDRLDNMPDGRPPLGFAVIGNLTVDGGILNETGDYGPVFYVAGNLTCRNLMVGGAPTRVEGDVRVEEMIMLHYNHGWMQCDGTFIAPIMIVDDYHLMPFRKEISQFYYNDNDAESPEVNECGESEDGDPVISENLRVLLNNPLTTDFEEIRRDLAAGESVTQPEEKTLEYWRNKVRRNYRDLKRVPMEMRTSNLCDEAMAYSVASLEYFPPGSITPELAAAAAERDGKALRYLPSELITRELCYLAAKHGAILKYDIPERFYEHALLCNVIKVSDWQMEHVPIVFITEDMLVLYVKAGRGAWLDRYCQQSGVSKQKVLERVMADDIKYLENVFNWHLSATTYAYARQRYDKPEYAEAWTAFNERFARKISRLNGNSSTPSS